MLGSLIPYLRGMRLIIFQLSGFDYTVLGRGSRRSGVMQVLV